MKNSAWTKLKRKKSTKSDKHKKQVHWSKQLEVVHVFDPEPECVFFTGIDNSVSENQADLQLKYTGTTAPVNATFELRQKLEKMSLENKVAQFSSEQRTAWQNVFDVENDSLQEDWVWCKCVQTDSILLRFSVTRNNAIVNCSRKTSAERTIKIFGCWTLSTSVVSITPKTNRTNYWQRGVVRKGYDARFMDDYFTKSPIYSLPFI